MVHNNARMTEQRPDPDALLQAVRSSVEHRTRGRLKIFFGATAGVGKTYAMLQEAGRQLQAGRDVIAGIVETHGRSETAELLSNITCLPQRKVMHRSVALSEFDLDAALARAPELILIDELAHSNAPGSRHLKRWQDVEELLEAGIDVYTTVNVQHLESLNDVVAQITSIVVHETIPDSILEQADEVELIDIPTEDLLQRLREGKVYLPLQAERALQAFFTKSNLTALRELALRKTAQQVDTQLQAERTLSRTQATWPAAERVIVCVSSSPHSADLVRAARRLATEAHADWEAVYVETAAGRELSGAARARLDTTLRLAESLGGEAVTLSGERVSETLVAYARQRNATKIVVGKPTHSPVLDRLRGSLVDALIRRSGDIDVYVVREQPLPAGKPAAALALPQTHSDWRDYLLAVGIVAATTVIAWPLHGRLQPANLIMLYLLAVVAVALRAGRGPALLAAVLAVAIFDFCFVPPYLTFAVRDVEYLLTFAAMLLVSLIIANLTFRLKQQVQASLARERRTSSLYKLSREMARAEDTAAIIAAGEQRVAELFRCNVLIVLRRELDAEFNQELRFSGLFDRLQSELAVMRWVLDNGKPAGKTTNTLPGAEALYLPITAGRGQLGVLAVKPNLAAAEMLSQPEQRHLLETCCTLVAIAVERELQEQARHDAEVQAERERMRSTLLSSISHDLRTPLASIAGSAETLLALPSAAVQSAERDLLSGVKTEADRLALLLENILDMTRLEAGNVSLNLEPQPLEEVIGATLQALEQRLLERKLELHIPDDLPLVFIDAVMIERVLANLLDNALKYTPPDSPLMLSARATGAWIEVSLADRGPGLPAIDPQQLFAPFNQYGGAGSTSAQSSRGIGLGLSICNEIVKAHGGAITAEQREGGGSVFSFTLPVSDVRVPEEQPGPPLRTISCEQDGGAP